MATIAYCGLAFSNYLFTISTILSFFIGISLYFDGFYKHFKVLVTQIDKPIEIKDLNSPLPPAVIQHKKEIQAKRILCEMIQLHIFAKE